MAAAAVRLFACGDVMTGRGVDQILPHPGDPELRERYLDDARAYVRLINLEPAVTCRADSAPAKGVHYRMSPQNLPCVATARPDVCALANNHRHGFRPGRP